MAGETITPLPADMGPSWLYVVPESIVKIYPSPTTEGTGSTRPTVGQVWPRGNTRGNT